MFNNEALKLIRLYKGFTLDEVARLIKTTRQYVHSLEVGNKKPSNEQILMFCMLFGVKPYFFNKNLTLSISEDDVHFRKLRSTKQAAKLQTIARLTLVSQITEILEQELNLPQVNFPPINNIDLSLNTIEDLALECRSNWGLGLHPISNMTRLAENNGCIVLNMDAIENSIDALSIFKHRPIILRNTFKESVCRRRFDIAHELGHMVLHQGIITGDTKTEKEANTFASALLLPKEIMIRYFPRPKNNRINWQEISEFKLKWKISKAAIFYRAHKLNLLSDSQYKTAVITLRTNGEAIHEKEDHLIVEEKPELIGTAISILGNRPFNYLEQVTGLTESTIRQLLYQLDSTELSKIIKFETIQK